MLVHGYRVKHASSCLWHLIALVAIPCDRRQNYHSRSTRRNEEVRVFGWLKQNRGIATARALSRDERRRFRAQIAAIHNASFISEAHLRTVCVAGVRECARACVRAASRPENFETVRPVPSHGGFCAPYSRTLLSNYQVSCDAVS